MSRIRSQLDTILDAAAEREGGHRPARQAPGMPRRAAPNAAYPDAARNPADMDRVRTQLDRLAGKLDEALRARADTRARQTDMQAPAGNPALTSEIERMRSEMGELRQMMAHYADPAAIAENLQRYQAVHGNGFTRDQAEARFSQLTEELRRISDAVAAVSSRAATPPEFDLSDVTRSIEAGYADIASRLEHAHNDPRFEDLSRQIAEMRTVIDALPQQLPLETLERRYKEIEDAILELAEQGTGQVARQITQLQESLDEVTRAIAAIATEPADTANGLERIEARIATLTKTVETIAESARQQSPEDLASRISGIADLPDEISGMMARIDERLDAIAQSGSGENPAIEALSQQLAEQLHAITQRLDEGAPLSSDFHAESSERIGQTGPAPMHVEQLDAIEAQLAAIFARLDGMSPEAGGEGGTPLSPDYGAELARAIDALSARFDSIAAQEQSESEGETSRLQSLEKQLDDITAMMREGPAANVDLTPLAERLDGVQQEFMQAVGRDLQNIEAQLARIGGEPGAEGSDTLAQILDRLNALQETMPAETHIEPAHTHSEVREQQFEEAGHEAESPTAQSVEPASYDLGDVDPAPPMATGLTEEDEEEIEDVPLEPGSGVPDLAALVRTASERRKSSRATDEAEGNAPDYLAAARRAAQAAASEVAAEKNAKDQQKKKKSKPAKEKGERKGIFGMSRKTLLGATAAVALLALGAPMAMSWLGIGNNGPVIIGDATDPENTATRQTGEAATTLQSEEEETANIGETEPDAPPAITEGSDDTAMVTPAIAGQDTQMHAAIPGGETQTGEDQAGSRMLSMQTDVPQQATTAAQAEEIELSAIPEPAEKAGNEVLRQAAREGEARALFEIARRYTDGEGVNRDLSEAAKWYELSAERGYAPAQYRFANFLEKGHGLDVDINASAGWYKRAAEKGNALSMHNLAVLHSSGMIGGKPDMDQAIGWFRKAADLGVKDSQVNLGIILAKGLGVDVDLVESYKWFAIAAKGGDADAASKRDMVANAMRPDQLEEARGKAEIWKPGQIDRDANVATTEPEWNAKQKKERASLSETEIIAETQKLLAKHGFDPGPADGVFGEKTRDAIIQFQKNAGIPADGNITPQLLKKLASDSA